MKKRNFLLILNFLFIGYSNAQNLQCPDIARTLKEYSISTSSDDYLNSVYDKYCEQSGDTKTSSAGLGLDAVIKAIPIKFTAKYNSSQEAVKNFCKNYSSITSSQKRDFTYEERIASKTLETIQACLFLQSQGVTITHNVVNSDQTAFF